MAYSLRGRHLRSQVVLKRAEKKLTTGRRQRGELSSHTPGWNFAVIVRQSPLLACQQIVFPEKWHSPEARLCVTGENGSRALRRRAIRFGWNRAGGDILDEFTSALCALAIGQNANSPRRNVTGFETEYASALDLDVKAEPVRAVHSSGSEEGHRGGDLALEVGAGTGNQALAELLSPRHAAHQRLVQAATLEG